ncbi:MAG: hypothetical protein IJH50_14115 [Kiritimatiellae bacterium]|nr:hypothetical protein [Kiritimatiellia bacterium]
MGIRLIAFAIALAASATASGADFTPYNMAQFLAGEREGCGGGGEFMV